MGGITVRENISLRRWFF